MADHPPPPSPPTPVPTPPSPPAAASPSPSAPAPTATAPTPSESAKDGCSYSLELTKQFITLASAAVAFILGLASAEATRPPFLLVLGVLLALVASVIFGLSCHARITGLIAKEQSYNAYDAVYLRLAKRQLGFFALGFLLLASFTVYGVWKNGREAKESSHLEIRYRETRISVPITNALELELRVTTNSVVALRVK
jgi:hypothetical protein